MNLFKKQLLISFVFCLLYFLAYSTLSIIRYNHYRSGYDLGIADQIVWKYAQFQSPITTVSNYSFTSLLADHVEFIYIIISPFYWIWNDARMLLLLQAFFISFSGVAIFLLAKRGRLNIYVSYAVLLSYLTFYGIQNAIWADVHSLVFGASFLPWLIYFLEEKRTKATIFVFLLAIFCKENIAGLTAVIGIVYFILTRRKIGLYLGIASIVYLFLIFGVYFPHFTSQGYRYGSNTELLSNINPYHLFDNNLKRNVFLYSFLSFGFLPIFSPLALIPTIADLYSYFVLANHIKATHELVQHYRVTLAALMIWPTIMLISKYKILNKKWMAAYLILFACLVQYVLHLPLSYLTKQWFWKESESVQNIIKVIRYLPQSSSVVAQNNITSHIAHRNMVFTLFPGTKSFKKNSPCSTQECNWFYWNGKPTYLMLDTSTDWDLRYFLTTREEFVNGLNNMVKAEYIKLYKKQGNAMLFLIKKQP